LQEEKEGEFIDNRDKKKEVRKRRDEDVVWSFMDLVDNPRVIKQKTIHASPFEYIKQWKEG
jgi:hypothetical protein